jgi:hypothetical protein
MSYWYRLWTSLTQLLNTLLGGWPDESLSSRVYRRRHRAGWDRAYIAINALFFWEVNHCRSAYESERLRRQMPPELRED